VTGYRVDLHEIAGYVRYSLDRAGELGVEYVVFGSGPAKNVPDSFPLDEGYRQVMELLRMISGIALRNGITIVIEPLRKAECNLINTFAEGCRLARDVNCGNVAVLVDFYHLSQENEPLQHLLDDGLQYLRHIHIAANKGRSYPSEKSADPFEDFFNVLHRIGYNRRISVEAYTDDFEKDARETLRFLLALSH
jgi:D-psicose/D-tagatose/L-ribulose 3-epimerase